jgi:hypothetical protein
VSKFAKTMERLLKQSSDLSHLTSNSQIDENYDYPAVDYYDETSSHLLSQEFTKSDTKAILRRLSSPKKKSYFTEENQLLINKLP